MPKFPEPPSVAQLAAIPPRARTLASGTLLWRIYFFRGGAHLGPWNQFRSFGPTNARFDHHLEPPQAQARGILYSAARVHTCFAEVFQETRVIDRRAKEPWLVGFHTSADLTLLDLTGNWPTQAGASMEINCGQRARARRWSQQIYAAYPAIHGLWYCSSMDGNHPAAAIYERGHIAMPAAPVFHRSLADPALASLVGTAAGLFNYLVV